MGSDPVDILERRYREVYEGMYAELQERRRVDPTFTIDDVRVFLKDAYVRQGNDWIGHGALFDATQGAIIAAYEAILAEWLSES
ncbi:MAG: hypothetical protein ACP5JG_08020 [Anaerolineae bacterium]